MKNSTILLIEDDEDIREGIRILLQSEDYEVKEAENGIVGLELLSDDVDLVILDVMMPGISGIQTCQRIREKSNVPALFLTAKSGELDKIAGFSAGGDDYLSKPFSYTELLGRVKALIRRYMVYSGKRLNDEKRENISVGDLTLSMDNGSVFKDGKEIELTDTEYKILRLFMKNPNKVFSAKNLYESVWHEPFMYSSNSTIMVHIRRLRKKIESTPEEPKHIITVWGKGYRFE